MSLWVVDIVIGGVDGELVIYSKYFSFSQTLLLILLFLQFLELEVPSEALDNNYFLIVILDARIRLWVERALVQLFHLTLAALHCNSLMLLLQLGPDPVLVHGRAASVADHARHALVEPRVLGMCLWLEG